MYSQNSNSQAVVNHIKKRKKDLIKVFHSKCCICGFDQFPEALEFHHVNPDEKQFGITDSKSVTKALDKQLNEMKKCILVCANCHRGIHQNYIKVPENYQDYYDEKIAQQLRNELNQIKTRKKYFCLRCGKQITRSGTYCVECSHIMQWHCDRPDRETLKDKIRKFPFTSIANEYKVTDNAVRKWCDSYNLPRTKKEIKTFTDQEWEKI